MSATWTSETDQLPLFCEGAIWQDTESIQVHSCPSPPFVADPFELFTTETALTPSVPTIVSSSDTESIQVHCCPSPPFVADPFELFAAETALSLSVPTVVPSSDTESIQVHSCPSPPFVADPFELFAAETALTPSVPTFVPSSSTTALRAVDGSGLAADDLPAFLIDTSTEDELRIERRRKRNHESAIKTNASKQDAHRQMPYKLRRIEQLEEQFKRTLEFLRVVSVGMPEAAESHRRRECLETKRLLNAAVQERDALELGFQSWRPSWSGYATKLQNLADVEAEIDLHKETIEVLESLTLRDYDVDMKIDKE